MPSVSPIGRLRGWRLGGWWAGMAAIGAVLAPFTTLVQAGVVAAVGGTYQGVGLWRAASGRDAATDGTRRRAVSSLEVLCVEASIVAAFMAGWALVAVTSGQK